MTTSEEKLVKEVKAKFQIYGNSEKLNNAILRATKFAKFDTSILIIGESGSGKDVFSKIIHTYSKRKNKNCLAVNCGSIPQSTIDSELFGYVKGAFTGAASDTKGYFEITDGGTLFLDEIGEMPLDTQTRLLRVLENGEFIKVGSNEVNKTNVRIVAATNRDLEKAINENKFRSDLYYRLSEITIVIPPLRERTEDIPIIARLFAADFAEKNAMGDKHFTPEALELLKRYSWPGNVRQLRSFVNMCMIESNSVEITAEMVKNNLPKNTVFTTEVATTAPKNGDNNDYLTLFQMMVTMIDRINTRIDEMHNKNEIAKPETNIYHEDVLYSRLPNKTITPTNNILNSKAEYDYDDFDSYDNMLNLNEDHPKECKSIIIENRSSYKPDDVIELDDNNEEYKSLKEIEKEAIEIALKRNNYNRKTTAQQLQIAERTLYRKIKDYDLD
ncbi:MAG: sigma 54-interacting transcriptional regulator [Muribaculaceae bacterium]